MRTVTILLFGLLLAGCATTNYTQPDTYENAENTITIDADLDTTWNAIIDYASSAFFGIDSFEKSSGLITLTFGADHPGAFVDCGYFKVSGLITFDDTYASWIYTNGGRLDGRMNITARPAGENQTEIRVNSRYVVHYQTDQGNYTWSFNTGSEDSQTVSNQAKRETRTCRATGEAEENILTGVYDILNR